MAKKSTISEDSVVNSVDGFYIYPMQLSNRMGTRYIYCKEEGYSLGSFVVKCSIQSGGAKDRLFMINVGECTEEQLRVLASVSFHV